MTYEMIGLLQGWQPSVVARIVSNVADHLITTTRIGNDAMIAN